MKKMQYKRFTRSKIGNFFYFFVLALMGLFTLVPMIYMVITSFKPLDELLIFPPRFFVIRPSLENYVALPSLLSGMKIPLSRYVFNSVFVAVICTVFQIFIGSMAAFVISKTKLKGVTILFLIVQFSLLYNGQTLAIPQYIIFSNLKIINTYWVYILPALQSSLSVFLFKQYIDASIPDALLEASRIDGANLFTIYWRILLPNIKPAWMTVGLFGFQSIWALQPAGTIFNEELRTLPSILTQISVGGIARSGSAMAASVLLMIPPILVYLVSQSNIMETMNSAGIKD